MKPIMLIMAVSETESATSPREIKVRTLEVTPPGQAARIISPAAKAGCMGKSKARKKR